MSWRSPTKRWQRCGARSIETTNPGMEGLGPMHHGTDVSLACRGARRPAGWAADIPFRRRVPHGSLRLLSNQGSDRRAAGAQTCPNSGNELIAAGLSYQELGMRGVLLDLLPQAVDVRLQRVRGDARVIAPYLLQQHVARHDLLASAIEILEDGGLLLRKSDFGAFLVNQHLRCRLERVVANGEHRVLALLVLAQLRANARQQHGELEGLGDVVVGAGIEAEDHVGIRHVAGEHDDGTLEAVLAQELAGLPAIHVR